MVLRLPRGCLAYRSTPAASAALLCSSPFSLSIFFRQLGAPPPIWTPTSSPLHHSQDRPHARTVLRPLPLPWCSGSRKAFMVTTVAKPGLRAPRGRAPGDAGRPLMDTVAASLPTILTLTTRLPSRAASAGSCSSSSSSALSSSILASVSDMWPLESAWWVVHRCRLSAPCVHALQPM